MVTELPEGRAAHDSGNGAVLPEEQGDLVQALLDEVVRRLEQLFHGRYSWVVKLGDPEKVASPMAAAIPTAFIENFRHGPSYMTAGLAELRSVSRQAIHQEHQAGRIVGAKHGSRLVYPWFQFGRDGALLPGLRETRPILAAQGRTEWDLIAWLACPCDRLSNVAPVRRLVDGDLQLVLAAAKSAEKTTLQSRDLDSSGPPAGQR